MLDNENMNPNPETPETPANPVPELTLESEPVYGYAQPAEPSAPQASYPGEQQVPPQYAPPHYTEASLPKTQPDVQVTPCYNPPDYFGAQANGTPVQPNPNDGPTAYYGQPPQQPVAYDYKPRYDVPPVGYQQKSRLAAGILAIMLGCFGIHNFYLNFNSRAIIQLVVSLAGGIITCGMATLAMEVWAFIEGIQLLSGHPSRLYDGNGVITKE